MLTVKWIKRNGEQVIYAAQGDVGFSPGARAEGDNPGRKGKVVFVSAEGHVPCSIDSGEVYVMNDAGRTVANYILSTVEFEHGLMPQAA
jgi:hypothetical protein